MRSPKDADQIDHKLRKGPTLPCIQSPEKLPNPKTEKTSRLKVEMKLCQGSPVSVNIHPRHRKSFMPMVSPDKAALKIASNEYIYDKYIYIYVYIHPWLLSIDMVLPKHGVYTPSCNFNIFNQGCFQQPTHNRGKMDRYRHQMVEIMIYP